VSGTGMIEAENCEAVSLNQGQLAVIPANSPAWRLRSAAQLQAIVASTPLASNE
jgi:hypothetical protein